MFLEKTRGKKGVYNFLLYLSSKPILIRISFFWDKKKTKSK